MIASMFPNNDLSSTITISLGLPQSGVDDDDSIIEFTAKKAAALINDYQTYLSQANYTSFGQYIILEIAIKQTGKNRQAYQAAFNESDGSMAPLWNLGPASSDQPLVASLSLFLPRDLMSAEAFDKTYTHVFKSGHESEWIERLAVLQPGLKDISPVKVGDSWDIHVRLSEFSLPMMAMGDGFKAASMIMADTLEPGLMLIDTPELFQHPKGLSLISKSIASAISEYGSQVILATQSLEFLDALMGDAKKAEIETKVFRFGFEGERAKVYPPYALQEAIDSRELIGSDLRD